LPLPPAAAERAGWAEPHFLVHTGQAPSTVVMLYPRHDLERDVIRRRIRASCAFALAPSGQPIAGTYEGVSVHNAHLRKGGAMPMHVVGPNDGEQSGGGPIRCRIIEDGSHTEHRLGLIEAIVPPGPAGPPQHVHHEHDEIFIVTEGRLRFTSGSESVDVEAGSCVTIPPGTPHTFSNPFGEQARFVGTLTPDLYVEYFRDLSRLPVDEKGMLNPADIGRTMAKYATEVMR
jgi:mannose-6-phosphate isomerase-like protein (cupin superfamily)